jgi:hypothetical protein
VPACAHVQLIYPRAKRRRELVNRMAVTTVGSSLRSLESLSLSYVVGYVRRPLVRMNGIVVGNWSTYCVTSLARRRRQREEMVNDGFGAAAIYVSDVCLYSRPMIARLLLDDWEQLSFGF